MVSRTTYDDIKINSCKWFILSLIHAFVLCFNSRFLHCTGSTLWISGRFMFSLYDLSRLKCRVWSYDLCSKKFLCSTNILNSIHSQKKYMWLEICGNYRYYSCGWGDILELAFGRYFKICFWYEWYVQMK